MKCIINGRILLPDRELAGRELWFDDRIRRICFPGEETAVPEEVIDAGGAYVSPGLVDLHIHGYLGQDVSDGEKDGILSIAQGILRNGVTSWCPTTMTVSVSDLKQAFAVCRELRENQPSDSARILGVHAEGPFINASKKGAQAAEHILLPDKELIWKHQDILRLITLAPEVSEQGMDFIRWVSQETGIVVSLGHTSADYETACKAYDCGARHTTHLFNAMTGLQHRAPGVVGAALSVPQVSCELIADTFHVHPGLFRLLYQIKKSRLVLITDCIRAGGLSDGEYTLGGQDVSVHGIECRLRDGTIAGSVLTLDRAVWNLHKYGNVPLYCAVAAASYAPARVLGEDRKIGSLRPGRNADLLLADSSFRIQKVFRMGQEVFNARKRQD